VKKQASSVDSVFPSECHQAKPATISFDGTCLKKLSHGRANVFRKSAGVSDNISQVETAKPSKLIPPEMVEVYERLGCLPVQLLFVPMDVSSIHNLPISSQSVSRFQEYLFHIPCKFTELAGQWIKQT